MQDITGDKKLRTSLRKVGISAVVDGNAGEIILEGAGADFVGMDSAGNRCTLEITTC